MEMFVSGIVLLNARNSTETEITPIKRHTTLLLPAVCIVCERRGVTLHVFMFIYMSSNDDIDHDDDDDNDDEQQWKIWIMKNSWWLKD